MSSFVCDRIHECDGWKNYNVSTWYVEDCQAREWRFCPWCGKTLDWERWERWERLGGTWTPPKPNKERNDEA